MADDDSNLHPGESEAGLPVDGLGSRGLGFSSFGFRLWKVFFWLRKTEQRNSMCSAIFPLSEHSEHAPA